MISFRDNNIFTPYVGNSRFPWERLPSPENSPKTELMSCEKEIYVNMYNDKYTVPIKTNVFISNTDCLRVVIDGEEKEDFYVNLRKNNDLCFDCKLHHYKNHFRFGRYSIVLECTNVLNFSLNDIIHISSITVFKESLLDSSCTDLYDTDDEDDIAINGVQTYKSVLGLLEEMNYPSEESIICENDFINNLSIEIPKNTTKITQFKRPDPPKPRVFNKKFTKLPPSEASELKDSFSEKLPELEPIESLIPEAPPLPIIPKAPPLPNNSPPPLPKKSFMEKFFNGFLII